ncbi:Hypothetical predicted protein [Mytilus galloprovincialis]|uniref:Ig-like domain-containing protein n=1 Tax=Mytilus galloprovincialis TaxID=29158 RepID=A0A8B6FB77_MYTGA|nr:Hypothetical predicted protein [Mytilus galloprovincialis]
MIVAVELTVPWEERCYEVYRKKKKFTELITTCRERVSKDGRSKSNLQFLQATLTFLRTGLPVVSIGNSVHSSKFGDSYSINCKVHSYPLHTHTYWQHSHNGNNRIITKDTPGVSGVSLDDSTLTLDIVTTSDTGWYICFAENTVGTGSSKRVSLTVDGDVPAVDVPLKRYTSKHNQDVALVCTVNSIPQHTIVYWEKETKNGKIILNHGTTGTIGITVTNPSLTLQPAATTDSGLYTCLASNAIGTGSSRAVLLIVTPEDEVDDIDNNQHGTNLYV